MKALLKITTALSLICATVGCGQSNSNTKAYPKQSIDTALQFEKSGFGVKRSIPKVDILFVIDSSGSMDPYQKTVSENMEKFVNNLVVRDNIDFRVGVLNSSLDEYNQAFDYDCANFVCSTGNATVEPVRLIGDFEPKGSGFSRHGGVPWIENRSQDLAAKLEERVKVGTNGSGTEVFFDVAVDFLKNDVALPDGSPERFSRADALLAVIFITDASDQSTNVTSGLQFYQVLSELKQNAAKVVGYGALISQDGDPQCSVDTSLPVEQESFIETSGGQKFDLCGTEFGEKFANIGGLISDRVVGTLVLSQLPSLSSLNVIVNNEILDPSQWSYDPIRNVITINNPAQFPPGAEISVAFLPAKFSNDSKTIGE